MTRRAGSRLSNIAALPIGGTLLVEVRGKAATLQQQLRTDAVRLGILIEQHLLVAVTASRPRAVFEVVRIVRRK